MTNLIGILLAAILASTSFANAESLVRYNHRYTSFGHRHYDRCGECGRHRHDYYQHRHQTDWDNYSGNYDEE